MSMIEQYPARPECVYGTREFEERRNARMAAMRKPVRRAADVTVEVAPFSGLREASAHYRGIRDRLFPVQPCVRPVIVPPPVVQEAKAPAPKKRVAPCTEEYGPSTMLYLAHLAAGRVLHVEVIRAVVLHFEGRRELIMSDSRLRKNVHPRQVAMYLAYHHCSTTYQEIGRRFGGRDHATVRHAVFKIEELVRTDPAVAADVAAIRASLNLKAVPE